MRRAHERFARAHPVAVALQRVDLAVVRDHAVRVRQRPRREGVGREAAVHQRQRRLDARVDQIGEELRRAAAWSACPCRPACGTTATGSTPPARPASRARMRLRATNSFRSRSMPVAAAGIVDEQLPEARHDARGRSRRPSLGSVGTSRQPSTRSPSSTMIASMRARLARQARIGGQEAQADAVGAARRAGRSRPPRAGTRPAPGSGCPRHRRCWPRRPERRDGRGCRGRRARSRRCRGSGAPLMSTTNETPQASCSKRGSYSPLVAGRLLKGNWAASWS